MSELITRNGESITIDSMIAALEIAPDKGEILEALKALRQDKVKKALGDTVKAARFDLPTVFDEFLTDRDRSEHTLVAYRHQIGRFTTWLEREQIHPLQVRRADVNRFKREITEKGLAANTIRLVLSSCSSFWSYLEAERYIDSTPFARIQYPKRQYRKAIRPDQEKPSPVMSADERSEILQTLEQRTEYEGNRSFEQKIRDSARRLLPAVHFMATYGLRVGDLIGVQIEDADRFTVKVKGGAVLQKVLRPISLEILERYSAPARRPFAKSPTTTIKNAIRRLTKEMSSRGILRAAYSSHDFRHLFAAELYQDTKDVLLVQREMGHSSVAITQVYLQQLGATAGVDNG